MRTSFSVCHCHRTSDISLDLRGALAPVVSKNHAAVVEPRKIGTLLSILVANGRVKAMSAEVRILALRHEREIGFPP